MPKQKRQYKKKRNYKKKKYSGGILDAYRKGNLHNFASRTAGFNFVNHSGWNVTPTADSVDSTMFKFQTPAATGISYAAIGFQLNDLVNISEFDVLFDYYKINGVKLSFYYLYDNAVFNGVSPAPQMYLIKDFDDSTVPASIGELIQYPGCKELQLFDQNQGKVVVYLKPRVMDNTTDEQQPSKRRPWIDMSAKDKVYHGVKFAVVNRAGSLINIYVRAKYYIQTKGQR